MSTRGTKARTGRRLTAFALTAALILGACSGDDGGPSSSDEPSTSGASTSTTDATTDPTNTTDPGGSDPTNPGLGFVGVSGIKLSEGSAVANAAEPVPLIDGTPLDQPSLDAVIARLPEWMVDASLAQPFNWPVETKPAPRAGVTVDGEFPAPQQVDPVDVATGPLNVLRFQPEGDVVIAPFASITFDQPMVPISTVSQLDQASVPATISPPLAGRWQWIGTRTLRFDATEAGADRLPMATEYTIEIPAGTTSATGGVLAEAVSFQFATPPVTVQSIQPTGESLPLAPVFLARFDQLIDPPAVLATVVITAGGETWPVRLATDEEAAADPLVGAQIESLPAGRWLAFRPVDPFPADAALEISIGPGTPSAEGPLTTTATVTYSGHTYEPLRITEVACGYGPNCPPPTDIYVTLNNALDLSLFDPAVITIEPELAGEVIGVYGNTITIAGATIGRTEYTITLPAGLTDIYGQQLGNDDDRTITIGSAQPMLAQFRQPFTTLDPFADKPALPVVTVNHDDFRLRAFAVEPSDWADYIDYTLNVIQNGERNPKQPPWPTVLDTIIDVDGEPDRITETSVDLSDLIDGQYGHVVLLVETTEQYDQNSEEYWQNRPTATWAQATSLGLDVFTDSDELRVWATDLTTGSPASSVTVGLLDESGSLMAEPAATTTDGDGLATMTLTSEYASALVATNGDDVALLPAGVYGGSWQRWDQPDEARWYVFDDRHVYRPGETVSIKGWTRRLTSATDGQLRLVGSNATVNFDVTDNQGNSIASGDADVNPLGGFDFTVEIPLGTNLGDAYVRLTLNGVDQLQYTEYGHSFQVQEFRRPEFEVNARHESDGPYLDGEPVTVAVDANYYAGGPLGAAPVDWQVTTSSATYSPPGWDDFEFGLWSPWWFGDIYSSYSPNDGYYGGYPGGPECCGDVGTSVAEFAGTTDSNGTHYLQIEADGLADNLAGLPATVNAQATVTDINRQAWASSTGVLVHPASFYVGLRSDRTFVRQGEPLDIEVIVSDIDGAAVPGRVATIVASRQESIFENGQWAVQDVDPQTCEVTSAAEAVTCTFDTETGGTYTIRASVVDDSDRTSRTEFTRWVSGADAVPSRTVEQQSLTIVPDKAEYNPGETAELLVQSPFDAGTGLLIISRSGITSTSSFPVVEGSAIVEVPITDADIPAMSVAIEVVGATERTNDDGTPVADGPLRPAFAVGQLALAVSTDSRSLSVSVEPQAETLEPGSSTAVDVTVTNAEGNPVAGSEFAVVVVDEAVLALSNLELADPLATFYTGLPYYLAAQYGRQSIILNDPQRLTAGSGDDESTSTDAPAETTAAATEESSADTLPMTSPVDGDNKNSSTAFDAPAAEASGGSTGGSIEVRTDFDALAVFEPSVITDAAGQATIEVELPDNLTRYRVMVVAVAGENQFGSSEANITARLPLMVRPSAPRFLNFGDTFQLPVIVQNQTDQEMIVDVVLQADNLTVAGNDGQDPAGQNLAGQQVTVPANDRVEVRFAVSAAQAGAARFRVAAASGDAADAATIELPVYTPATAEAFATYGVIDEGATLQPVAAPTDVIPQFGGLDVTTSSTSLQALTDAVLYISEYPYRSTDAMASRILAIASLRDVLDAFDAPGLPRPAALDGAVTTDIAGLIGLQNGDGGFPYWERGRRSDVFNSVQATHALVVARDGGFSVDQYALDSALFFLRDIEQYIPSEYGQEARDSIGAYALNVRMLAGDQDSGKAEALFDDRGEDLPLDAIAWLWPVVDNPATGDAIERIIQNIAVDTAGAVTFTSAVSDDAYLTLRSDRRTDGLILDALIRERPDSDLIPKVVAGLLAGQTKGRWDNIQENSFILLALKRYFDTYEDQTPDFVAQVWLGERFAGEQSFVGRSTDRVRITIPTADLISAGSTGGTSDLTINKVGTGRLYYRIGLRTSPTDLVLDPLDRGFVVARTYEAVDDPADVTRDPDGTWHIKAGASVRVRLTMVAESQRTHVALIDPLPAGLEILNPALATTPDIPADPEFSEDFGDSGGEAWSDSWWYQTWFDHQNIRDDRAEAFATYLSAGTYDYSYVARATTPGTFVVPPVRAEEMYAPETFGRGSTDTVIIDG